MSRRSTSNDGAVGPDPDPSPSVHPRDVTDDQPHAFADACFYDIVFDSLDDDGGNATDVSSQSSSAGNADSDRGPGYWQTSTGNGRRHSATARRQCYLAIVAFMSIVSSTRRAR